MQHALWVMLLTKILYATHMLPEMLHGYYIFPNVTFVLQ